LARLALHHCHMVRMEQLMTYPSYVLNVLELM